MEESLGRDPELIIINHTISYRFKRDLVNIYFRRCEGNWFIEDTEIDFPPPEDTGRHVAQYSLMRGLETQGNGANRVERGQFCKVYSFAKFRFLW
jgi:hypothetical protein